MHIYQKNTVFQIRLVEKRTFRFDSKTFFVKFWQIFVAKFFQNIQISIIIYKVVTLSQYYKWPKKKNCLLKRFL